MKKIFTLCFLFFQLQYSTGQNISTYAGGNLGDNLPATYAIFNYVWACALDANGNIYVVDSGNQRIRKISSSGIITTVAGNGKAGFSGDGGTAINSQLYNPSGIAIDNSGNIYIADNNNNRIRKITIATGIITTIAGNGSYTFSGDGGLAINAGLTPRSLAIDNLGNIYFSDISARIRKINASTGIISTVAGNGISAFSGDGGQATSASLKGASGIAIDSFGNLFIADVQNYRIRKVNTSGIITTVAGNGISGQLGDGGLATSANLLAPVDVSVDINGNLFVADYKSGDAPCIAPCAPSSESSKIRRIDSSTGIITTVAGNGSNGFSGDGGLATNASLNGPRGIAVAQNGDLIIADYGNERIRKIVATSGIITTIAGQGYGNSFYGDGGAATNAIFNRPWGVATDNQGNLYIADSFNNRIRKVTKTTGIITTIAGNGIMGYGGDGGLATAASIMCGSGIATDINGNIFFGDYIRVRKITISTGIITTVAGNGSYGYGGDGGLAINATLTYPKGIAVDSNGNIFIADSNNNRVRMISATTGIITTVAGNGTSGFYGDYGSPTNAQLWGPEAVAVDANGTLYIADTQNNRIRRVGYLPPPINNTVITTIGNTSWPKGITLDNQGNAYISTSSYVNKINLTSGIISGIAGFGTGGDGGPAYSAGITPLGITIDTKGILYISQNNPKQIIRKVQATATITVSNTTQSYTGTGKSITIATTPPGLNVNVTYNGTTTLPINAGSYAVVATVTGPDPDYYGQATATLTINKATLNVTATNTSRSYGAVNPTFALTYSGFQNGETVSVIDVLPTAICSATSTSNVGTYPIIPSGGTDNNYLLTYTNGYLSINKANLNVTANNASKTYGATNPAFTLSYSGFQNGETSSVIDTPPSATSTATVNSNVGNYPITPAGGLDNNYSFLFINGTLSINKAILNVTANNANRSYGTVNPSLTNSYTGFVNGETIGVIDVLPTTSTTAIVTSNVGSYPITPSGGTDNNYSFSYINGSLTINKATLVVTASNAARNYGATNPIFTLTYAGFQNGETAAVIDTAPVTTSPATVTSNAGTYPIIPTGGSDNNYSFSYINGTLTINKTNLTITANNISKIYGSTNPTLSYTYSGFLNGETSAVIDTPPSITTTATTGSNTGTYPITLAGGSDNNYTFSLVNGILTINPAILTVTASSASRTYGAANPTISNSYSGFVNGETLSVVDVQPTISTTATVASNAGTYPTIPVGGADNNYSFSYINGSLTINKAILNATANNTSRDYLQSNPAFSISYSGFLNGDNSTVIDTPPTASTSATTSSSPGTYPITPSGGLDNNYSFNYINGTLTINAPICSININTSGNLCTDGRLRLSAFATGGTPISYAWSTGENSNKIFVYWGGYYSVTVYFTNGCSATSNIQINDASGPNCIYYLMAAPEPDPEPIIENIRIFPNPVHEELSVELPNEFLTQYESTIPLSLFDAVGKIAFQSEFKKNQNKIKINTTEMTEGIYIVQIGDGKSGVVRKKVMIVHKQ